MDSEQQQEPEFPQSEPRWHGAGPGCSESYFGGPRGSFHEEQFEAVWDLIHKLAERRDGNNWPTLRVVYTRRGEKNQVIAYRWTSEWARSRYEGELVVAGSSLARGVFEPFGGDPANIHLFYTWVIGDPNHPLLP